MIEEVRDVTIPEGIVKKCHEILDLPALLTDIPFADFSHSCALAAFKDYRVIKRAERE